MVARSRLDGAVEPVDDGADGIDLFEQANLASHERGELRPQLPRAVGAALDALRERLDLRLELAVVADVDLLNGLQLLVAAALVASGEKVAGVKK